MWVNVDADLRSSGLTFDTLTTDVETILAADLKDDAFLGFAVLAHVGAASILTGQRGCRKTHGLSLTGRSLLTHKHLLHYGGTLGLLLPKDAVEERRQF